ncbi:MAG: helix-turn-helix transcriptional regulator [Defluviitaleaceae bacterium]|nr:helix-turn-helix transcriptional regulator [Defluviitaleaceae bacterium]MCL2262761.1 helix-turn-helix transcriptional regulator [Defluviitaleaceae bacterium]
MYTEVFASRLKKAREYNGITQHEVSRTIKISQSTYANYEAGKREPNLETLALLSRLYNTKSDWLIGLTSDSGLNELSQILEERERKRILEKMEKEAELARRVWG